MGLKVFKGESVRSYENIFFRSFATNLKKLFDKYSFDGLLIGFPKCRYDRTLEPDAILITERVVIIIDFKNYGGTLDIPKEKFKNGKWYFSKNNKKEKWIKGGVADNPYSQLLYQKKKYIEIIEKHIESELHNQNIINPHHTVMMVCFQQPVEYASIIPKNIELVFSIADERNYQERIKDFIDIKQSETYITKESYHLFNNIFIAKPYLEEEPYIEKEIANYPKTEGNSITENIIEVVQDKEKKIVPFKPDYIFNITDIAKCFTEINNNKYAVWQKYFVSLLTPFNTSIPLFVGNVVNNLFDMIIQNMKEKDYIMSKERRNDIPDGTTSFIEHLKQTFINFPLEYIALLDKKEDTKNFYNKIKCHYDNLVAVVKEDFKKENVGIISFENVHIEPTFINKELGIQGRLDLLYADKERLRVIELKSSKEPFPSYIKTKINEDHAKQGQMYHLLMSNIKKYEKLEKRNIIAILYSSINKKKNEENSNLRWVSLEYPKSIVNKECLDTKKEKLDYKDEIILLRNKILKEHKRIIDSDDDHFIEEFFNSLKFDNTKIDLKGNENLNWVKRDYDNLQNVLKQLKNVTTSYFYAYFRYLLQEQYLNKVGDGFNHGQSGAWKEKMLSTMSDKIVGLDIKSEQGVEIHKTSFNVTLRMNDSDFDSQYLDFRVGDICMLYKQSKSEANVTDGQIYKCTISSINNDEYTLHFRHKPSDSSIEKTFKPQDPKWALVHDHSDTSFFMMMETLGWLISISKEKQSMILGTVKPKYTKQNFDFTGISDGSFNENADAVIQRNNILTSILSAQEYYLLCGPPGTGKTNIIIKHLVKYLYQKTDEKVLIVAYTNRAVDEICSALNDALSIDAPETNAEDNPTHPFIRLGSRVTARETYQKNILSKIVEEVNDADKIQNKRKVIKDILIKNRIYVSTVYSLYSNKIIKDIILKFNTCIVDEASQILEPTLIGLYNYANKLVLIGDDKQLPAISKQPKEQSMRFNKQTLKAISMENLSDSYFDRMLRNAKQKEWHHCHGTLTLQGRMHPQVSEYVNKYYYGNILIPIGLTHQSEKEIHIVPDTFMPPNILKLYSEQLLTKRVIFINTPIHHNYKSLKVSPIQAELTANIIRFIDELSIENIEDKVGVITLYRSQVAMIKSRLLSENQANNTNTNTGSKNGNDYKKIFIDTVESFQGSQKDFIIINLSVNTQNQLDFLKSHTKEVKSGIENQSVVIDKKLNVAITRARKQVIILGNDELIGKLEVYRHIIDYIQERNGYIDCNPKWEELNDQ